MKASSSWCLLSHNLHPIYEFIYVDSWHLMISIIVLCFSKPIIIIIIVINVMVEYISTNINNVESYQISKIYIMIQLLGGTEHPQTSIAGLRIHNLRVLFRCFKLWVKFIILAVVFKFQRDIYNQQTTDRGYNNITYIQAMDEPSKAKARFHFTTLPSLNRLSHPKMLNIDCLLSLLVLFCLGFKSVCLVCLRSRPVDPDVVRPLVW